MATCREVIKRALRRLNLLAAGREPKASEAVDGLTALQGLYYTLISSGSLGALNPVQISAAYTAKEWDRIAITSGTPTITLPLTITDPAEPTGYRAPRDRALVVEASASPQHFIYEAVLNAWVQIEALTLDSTAPLSTQLSEGLAARLALSIADEYGVAVPPTVALAARGFMAAITTRPAEQRQPLHSTYY